MRSPLHLPAHKQCLTFGIYILWSSRGSLSKRLLMHEKFEQQNPICCRLPCPYTANSPAYLHQAAAGANFHRLADGNRLGRTARFDAQEGQLEGLILRHNAVHSGR
jgi:hypothetical protein